MRVLNISDSYGINQIFGRDVYKMFESHVDMNQRFLTHVDMSQIS
jgi:hypothetical protein